MDIRALQEALAMRDKLEQKRKSMMADLKMTEQQLNAQRPSTSGSVKELFSDGGDEEQVNKKLASGANYDAQKDVMHLVMIHETLTNWLSTTMLPRFKAEKAENYRKILKHFACLEIENSCNYSRMWSNVMNYHSQQAD
jgi:hypothetical protein